MAALSVAGSREPHRSRVPVILSGVAQRTWQRISPLKRRECILLKLVSALTGNWSFRWEQELCGGKGPSARFRGSQHPWCTHRSIGDGPRVGHRSAPPPVASSFDLDLLSACSVKCLLLISLRLTSIQGCCKHQKLPRRGQPSISAPHSLQFRIALPARLLVTGHFQAAQVSLKAVLPTPLHHTMAGSQTTSLPATWPSTPHSLSSRPPQHLSPSSLNRLDPGAAHLQTQSSPSHTCRRSCFPGCKHSLLHKTRRPLPHQPLQILQPHPRQMAAARRPLLPSLLSTMRTSSSTSSCTSSSSTPATSSQ